LKNKKKICVAINNRANYARVKSLLSEIKKNKNFELQILLGASAILSRFGELNNILKKDGFKNFKKIYSIVEGENLTTMAKSTGLSIIETSTFFENYKPDAVIVIADRFENLSVAISASYLNIPLIHIQGGEVTGSIDEKVRHAITKLSDLHFVATKRSRKFLIKMGENKKNVFLTGCPSIDIAHNAKSKLSKDFFKKNRGVGIAPEYNEKYIVVMHHPETTKFNEIYSQILQTIHAILKLKDIKIVWLWPNIDAGSDIISKQLRILRENKLIKNISFFKNFSPENYIKLISNCECLVGNSSSGIRESSFLSIPVVNIGSRQKNRERGLNVIDVGYNKNQIFNAILKQMKKKEKIKKSFLYGDGFAYKKIFKLLIKIMKKNISVEKQLNYL
jgi:UDP-hydrolysing UDP-N-acetyl-D-glucosamine 2-epimerase|tara:strand:+ start:316 stop:1488 length:1173 start_codon:yes stop_codon:yes gene_type:complete